MSEEVNRILQQTILPRLRQQYEDDVGTFSKTLTSELLRELHSETTARVLAGRLPDLSSSQEPKDVLLGLMKTMSGPKDLSNVMDVLRQSKYKGWTLDPETASVISRQSPNIQPISRFQR